MSSYHGWTHAPKEQGGTDPIPAATASAVVQKMFQCHSNSAQTVLDGAYDPLLFAAEDVSEGSPFTTVDHKTFVLAAGFWLVGCNVATSYTNSGALALIILTLVNPVTTGQLGTFRVTDPPDSGELYDGSASVSGIWHFEPGVVELQARLFQGAGATMTLGTGDGTYIYGTLLKPDP